jgi:hypothetical protein
VLQLIGMNLLATTFNLGLISVALCHSQSVSGSVGLERCRMGRVPELYAGHIHKGSSKSLTKCLCPLQVALDIDL